MKGGGKKGQQGGGKGRGRRRGVQPGESGSKSKSKSKSGSESEWGGEESTDAMLAVAKQRLEAFDFVGLFSRYEDSLTLFKLVVGAFNLNFNLT